MKKYLLLLFLLLIPTVVDAKVLNVSTRFEDESDKKVISEIGIDTTGINDGTRDWIYLYRESDYKKNINYPYNEFTFFTYVVKMGKTIDDYGIYEVELDGDIEETDDYINMKLLVKKNPNSKVKTSYITKVVTSTTTTTPRPGKTNIPGSSSTTQKSNPTDQTSQTDQSGTSSVDESTSGSNVTNTSETTTINKEEKEKNKKEKKRFDFYLMVWVILALVVLIFVLFSIVKAIRVSKLK